MKYTKKSFVKKKLFIGGPHVNPDIISYEIKNFQLPVFVGVLDRIRIGFWKVFGNQEKFQA